MKRSTSPGRGGAASAGSAPRPSSTRLGPPTTAEEARADGLDALRLATTLMRRHRTSLKSDPMKLVLRGAISMVWLAVICGCQVILLSRAPGARARGGPQDIRAAKRAAATSTERNYVAVASRAEADLYEAGFVQGQLDADDVEAWLAIAWASLAPRRKS